MAQPERRTRRGRQAEAERNDRRVLDAAREVFAEHGADATVAAIAERAGVGMGSLYRRYGSKADLLRHLCIQAMEQSIEAAQAALAATDAWTGLVSYVRACVAQGTGALAPLAGASSRPHRRCGRPAGTAATCSIDLSAALTARAPCAPMPPRSTSPG